MGTTIFGAGHDYSPNFTWIGDRVSGQVNVAAGTLTTPGGSIYATNGQLPAITQPGPRAGTIDHFQMGGGRASSLSAKDPGQLPPGTYRLPVSGGGMTFDHSAYNLYPWASSAPRAVGMPAGLSVEVKVPASGDLMVRVPELGIDWTAVPPASLSRDAARPVTLHPSPAFLQQVKVGSYYGPSNVNVELRLLTGPAYRNPVVGVDVKLGENNTYSWNGDYAP